MWVAGACVWSGSQTAIVTRRLIILSILLLGLGTLAWLKLQLTAGDAPSQPPARAASGSSPAPLAVQVMTMRPTTFAETITATGTLRAAEAVELQAETSGKITAILFHEGTTVRHGDLLVKINDADLQASRKRAVARQQLAAIREGRLAKLVLEGGANQQDYDAAASELQVQHAEIQLIDAQIAKTEIRAPFDGVIGLRFVSAGSYVSPVSRIATLQSVDTVKLDFSIPEKYSGHVRPGQPVKFTITGETITFVGEVFAIEPRIDELTRTLLLRATVPNSHGRLLPGAFAHVGLALAAHDDALLVPAMAVVPGLVEKNVFVVEDGKAVHRPVQLGMRTETEVQILAGLSPGDVVITSGLQSLRSGQAVQPRAEGG